ncbi:thioesterase family protein [Polaribacter sp.]|uniref:thioesterase family protein n=1 Tax=Polaribacter sp. TaxID=1920175 RepID=UPI003F6ACA04
MFQRNYKVKGEDVNDFMVMQNAAFLNYASTIFDTFLYTNGFAKIKMNALKLGLQKVNDQQVHFKNLMFTQKFSTSLEFKQIDVSGKMFVEINFYNAKNELCVTLKRALFWFDYTSWSAVEPPKKIANYFIDKDTYLKVS